MTENGHSSEKGWLVPDHENYTPRFALSRFMKGEAAEIVEKLLGIIKDNLVAREDALVSGFGKWSVKDKSERRGRHPQTGDELLLDGRGVVTWKYSPKLKDSLNLDRD
jgi:integration host factor subunit alpha